MAVVAHLSDLHFGSASPAVAAAACNYLKTLQPAWVAISGDFTQRARRAEFQQARAFIDSLPGTKLLVPGNHDIPLYNLPARIWWPLRNYRRFISSDLEPLVYDSEIVLIGINTARSLTWKQGRINPEQAETARSRLCAFGPDVAKLVVTHHPFDLAECHSDRVVVGRSRMAMEKLAACGADVLLAGHFHQSYTGGTANRYRIHSRSALVVQAGTATSTRHRGDGNSFNVLRISMPRIEVEILRYDPRNQCFVTVETKSYLRDPATGFRRMA